MTRSQARQNAEDQGSLAWLNAVIKGHTFFTQKIPRAEMCLFGEHILRAGLFFDAQPTLCQSCSSGIALGFGITTPAGVEYVCLSCTATSTTARGVWKSGDVHLQFERFPTFMDVATHLGSFSMCALGEVPISTTELDFAINSTCTAEELNADQGDIKPYETLWARLWQSCEDYELDIVRTLFLIINFVDISFPIGNYAFDAAVNMIDPKHPENRCDRGRNAMNPQFLIAVYTILPTLFPDETLKQVWERVEIQLSHTSCIILSCILHSLVKNH